MVSAEGVQDRAALLKHAQGSPLQPAGKGSQLAAGEDAVSTQMRRSDESLPHTQEGRVSDGAVGAAEHQPAAHGSPARQGRVFGNHVQPGTARQLAASVCPAQVAGTVAEYAVSERIPLAPALQMQTAA